MQNVREGGFNTNSLNRAHCCKKTFSCTESIRCRHTIKQVSVENNIPKKSSNVHSTCFATNQPTTQTQMPGVFPGEAGWRREKCRASHHSCLAFSLARPGWRREKCRASHHSCLAFSLARPGWRREKCRASHHECLAFSLANPRLATT